MTLVELVEELELSYPEKVATLSGATRTRWRPSSTMISDPVTPTRSTSWRLTFEGCSASARKGPAFTSRVVRRTTPSRREAAQRLAAATDVVEGQPVVLFVHDVE